MCIYLKNIIAKVHPNTIRNNGALGNTWKSVTPQEQE